MQTRLVEWLLLAVGLRLSWWQVVHEGVHEEKRPMMRQLREGIAEGARPVIALAYTSSFVALGTHLIGS